MPTLINVAIEQEKYTLHLWGSQAGRRPQTDNAHTHASARDICVLQGKGPK